MECCDNCRRRYDLKKSICLLFAYTRLFCYMKQIYKKNETEIGQNLRNNVERQAGWLSFEK